MPEAQAAAALDLALRLLLLLAELHPPLSAADRASPLPWFCLGSAAPAAHSAEAEELLTCRATLLHSLAAHPRLRCLLLLCCAHVAAAGFLPDYVVHRLGYPQQLLPLGWAQRALERGGADAAAAVLREPAQELARGVETAAQLEAHSVLALSLLRLDLAAGSRLLVDAEHGSGTRGRFDADASGAAARAALRLVERGYRQLTPLKVLPVALVSLLQEGVAAAVGTGSAAARAGLVRACLSGEVHPAVAAALAAVVVARGATPDDAALLLEWWAAGYCSKVQAWGVAHGN